MNEKKIYFDATFLHYGDDLRGIPQVIFQLVRLFTQNREFDSVHFIATEKVRSSFLRALGIPAERIEIVSPVPFPANDIRLHGFLCGLRYRKLKKRAAFIIHPEYRTVLKSSFPQAVLYHDFIFLSDYGASGRRGIARAALLYLYRCYIRYKLSISCRASYRLSVSEATKRHLLALFPRIPADTVSVLHNGIRFSRQTDPQPKSAPRARATFLAVGGVDDPRKNYFALIRNMPLITKNRPFDLHIVGKSPRAFLEKMSFLVKSMHLEASVSFHGTVPDDQLRNYYKNADFFLFPSLFEGFGLPLVEAMSQGCVVCAFNNSSIPEVGGDAIVLSENNDFAAWSEAINRFILDTAAYRELSEKAIKRARVFSEEQMFERYGAYFKNVLRS